MATNVFAIWVGLSPTRSLAPSSSLTASPMRLRTAPLTVPMSRLPRVHPPPPHQPSAPLLARGRRRARVSRAAACYSAWQRSQLRAIASHSDWLQKDKRDDEEKRTGKGSKENPHGRRDAAQRSQRAAAPQPGELGLADSPAPPRARALGPPNAHATIIVPARTQRFQSTRAHQHWRWKQI